jgi:hypothetical protein
VTGPRFASDSINLEAQYICPVFLLYNYMICIPHLADGFAA